MGDMWTRSWIAWTVICVGLLSVVGFSVAAIGFADGTNRVDVTQQVLTALFALVGTWVGTVLAFYFGRENFNSASRNTIDALNASGMGETTRVIDVMTKRDAFTFCPLAGRSLDKVPLNELTELMKGASVNRIVILDSGDVVAAVVHESVIARYEAKQSRNEVDTRPGTVGDLLADAEISPLLAAMAFVSPTATVPEARKKMASVANCNDVFVTSGGGKGDPAIGWLTNSRLAKTQ